MSKLQKMIILAGAVVLLIVAAGAHPQLSLDEQNAIVEAVVQTLNPDNMKATLMAEIEADLAAKFNAAGYVGVAGAISQPLPAVTAEPQRLRKNRLKRLRLPPELQQNPRVSG